MPVHISISPTANTVPFDNSSNGMTATNIQTAIEEARTKTPALREVILINNINTSSDLLFETDSTNSVINFFYESVI